MKVHDKAAAARSDMPHRAPYQGGFRTTTAPLIVTPTLVSRVDATPWAERPHDKGASVGRDGREVEHPDRHPEALALEPDRNLAFEHWDEYWRKVHGPKFAYEEPGSTSQPVLRYDQLHRIPGGPSSFFRPPYAAMAEADGRLVGDPQARVPAYGRPRWDGMAYIAYPDEESIQRTLGQEKYAQRIIADEHTAFRTVTRGISREHIILASERHRDPISLVKLHVRQPRLSREQFQRHWLEEHAALLVSKPATHAYVRRYAQLHNIGSTQDDPEGSRIDGISVLAFASVNDVEDYLVTEDYAAIEADEAELAGEGSEFWTALNYSVINRLLPELPTER
ncbi:EthD family reductase [Roseomonas indoligenes]|uniref:EthD family reductase n=1 Tax=Roseomonas indoligenes TaxID=2820811 RepID=A0A940SAK8_9PROT|nr:EthD family reductase [Pararoseomonas indoligenes]MBP0496302.1 EthD family reductase [Pararoseomonas indoligenes]